MENIDQMHSYDASPSFQNQMGTKANMCDNLEDLNQELPEFYKPQEERLIEYFKQSANNDNLDVISERKKSINNQMDSEEESKFKEEKELEFEAKLNEISQFAPVDILQYIVYLIMEKSNTGDSFEAELAICFLVFVSQIENNKEIVDYIQQMKGSIAKLDKLSKRNENCLDNVESPSNIYNSVKSTLNNKRLLKYNFDSIRSLKSTPSINEINLNYQKEELVEKSLLHCIRVESIKCIRYVITNAHKQNTHINLNHNILLGLLDDIERHKTKRILNELINKDIYIFFDSEEQIKGFNKSQENVCDGENLLEEVKNQKLSFNPPPRK